MIAAWQIAGQTCVQVFFVRGGRNNGNRAFFPTHARTEERGRGAGRLHRPVLRRQAAAAAAADQSCAAGAGAGGRGADRSRRGARWRSRCRSAARSAPWCCTPRPTRARRWSASWPSPPARRSCWKATAELFGLPAPPERIEVYDNSHIMGTKPYGVMIVGGPGGLRAKPPTGNSRIRGPIAPGDDFAMMREVLERRFGRALQRAGRDPERPARTGPTSC